MEAIKVGDIIHAVKGELLYGSKDTIVTSVSTNSNDLEQGALFVPIIGERVDAHDYIDSAFAHGAVATFTSRNDLNFDQTKVYILVHDTIEAMQTLAAYYRSLLSIPVVGITGSVGKTTTKEMISAALSTQYNVLKTAGNMNSQVGLPLTVFRIEHEHEVAVIEMGMSEEGEMARLAHVAKPTMAVITNIGVSHIAQLGSRENIRKEKMNIIDEMQGHSNQLYINGDDDMLCQVIQTQSNLQQTESTSIIDLCEPTKSCLKKIKVSSFGTKAPADYYAKNIRFEDGKTYFTFVYPEGEEDIVLKVLGIHNVNNAISALAIAMQLQIPPNVAKVGLFNYEPIAMRGQIFDVDGIKIIDDTYNASPDSMKSGIQVLLSMENVKKRIAVLADVLELGEGSHDLHYSVGTYIADLNEENQQAHVNEVVVIGSAAKAIVKALLDRNSEVVTHTFQTNEQAADYLKACCKPNDAMLIKGSRGMRTDEIVKRFIK